MKLNIYYYNNYINRKVLQENDLISYGTPIIVISDNLNFKEQDLYTTQIANYNGSGNYAILVDDNNNILSRWFITDRKRTRKGQYELSLKRDVLVDNYENVINAPMIINKGMVNYDNPLIFNDEGFNFNEIKQQERLLVDSQNMFPYLVLYCAKNMADKNNIAVKAEWTPSADIVLNTTIDQSIYASGSYNSLAQDSYVNFWCRWVIGSTPQASTSRKYSSLNSTFVVQQSNENIGEIITRTETVDEVRNNLILAINSYMSMYEDDYRLTQVNKISEATRLIYENALNRDFVVEDVNGKFYKVIISKKVNNYNKVDINDTMSMFNDLRDNINEYYTYTPTNKSFDYYYREYTYTITTLLLENYSFNASVTPSTHNITNDSECNIILLPYGDIKLVYAVDPDTGVESYDYIYKEDQLTIARAIAREYTNSVIYDMQLLPYAPYQNITNGDSFYYYQLNTSEYELQSYNGEVKGILLYPSISNFSFNLYATFNVNSYSDNQAINYKIESNCTKHRLCSPNYNGIFEWNNAKNGGVNFFNIDITYRPYNPYIHINPNFKNIYGSDYNDCRGLICQGDFSLPITGDAFAQYELNNKNYLNVFDREIKHMDFTNYYASRDAAVGIVTGTAQGIVGGAMAGGMMGGGYGAIAGGIIGGASSLAGGFVDYDTLQNTQRENKSLAIDKFNYSLGNIKALPYSINKLTPLTYNNKIFPFVEVYSCTDTEKEILNNKIVYNGMTLNTIGNISDFKTNYAQDNDIHFYQGTIIRIDGDIENNVCEEINSELMKGVYI